MDVIEGIGQLQGALSYPVVTVGTFDGVHIGHQAVLREIRQRSLEREGTSVVVTFEPHPQTIVAPEAAPMLLTTREEKLCAFAQEGIQQAVLLAFSPEIARMGARDFVREILLSAIGAKEVVVGYDHAFGRRRSGHLETLAALGQELGFVVNVVSSVQIDGVPVSSTRIRRLVDAGRIEEANRLLGRFYPLEGKIVPGDARGRTLGFRTANVQIDHPRKLIVGDGVYAVRVHVGSACHQGVMNIGIRPSFGAGPRTVEIHILHFEGDL